MRLRRHDLVWLSRAGWDHLLQAPHEAHERECIAHWSQAHLPLVVGRQDPACEDLALGLAAPLAWGRRRIRLRIAPQTVLYHDAFPRASHLASLLPVALRPQWAALLASLAECGVDPRVHGSYGWQRVTGLPYLVPTSDIDLQLPVSDPHAADGVARRLEAFRWLGPRIDGELVFSTGCAVAWREWLQWRRGAASRILVKRLDGVGLEDGLDWLESRRAMPA